MVRKGRQCLWLERVPVPTSCMHYGGSVTTFRSNRHRHSHYTVLLGTPLLAPLECAPAALWLDYTVTCLTQHTWKLVLVGEPVLAPAPKVAVVLERTNIYVYSIRTTQGEVLPSMDSTMVRQGSLLLAWSALCFSLCQCATVPIDRLPRSVMTREVFEEYMNKGRLLVVEGGASEWKALDEWDLDWFISRFPDDAIQLRSARSGMTYEERPQMTLGEYKGWVADKLDGKHYFSWVNNDETVSQQHLQEYVHLLQCPSSLAYSHKARTLPPRYFSVPHYFPANAKSHWHPEWIYFGTSRSGVDRHMDTMCSAKWSVHLRGIKKWVLSDPLVRRGPKYTATLQPGDILLFFPQCVLALIQRPGRVHDGVSFATNTAVGAWWQVLARNCHADQRFAVIQQLF